MTVAAVILAASSEPALVEVDGVPNVRRLADVAWAGGAMPIVVLAPDPDGTVRTALAGSEATYAEPAPAGRGPVGQVVRAIDVALGAVSGSEAALVWPARMGWVDAETVTSLIEGHGVDRGRILRPSYAGAPGWPVLVPVALLETLRTLPADLPIDGLVERLGGLAPWRLIEVGDPGATHGLETPRDALPPFDGPPDPASGHVHEWGAAAAERGEDAPLDGPPEAPDTGQDG